MKFALLVAVVSAIQLEDISKAPKKDVANSNINPWVYEYSRDAVLPIAHGRSTDKMPVAGSYPPHGVAGWPETKRTDAEHAADVAAKATAPEDIKDPAKAAADKAEGKA